MSNPIAPKPVVSRELLTLAAKQLKRVNTDRKLKQAQFVLGFDDGHLVLEIPGATDSVPATGRWPGLPCQYVYIMIYSMVYNNLAMHDVVKELGFLALGTRFKRIGESLQAQTQELLMSSGIDIPAGHFPLLAALDRLGPLGVSELSQAVGVSQPVVSRSLLALESNGLVTSVPVAADRRVRRIRLSRKGQELVQHAKRAVWPVIEAAVAQACKPLNGSLLEQLAGLEAAIEQTSLLQRAPATSSAPPAPLRRRPAR